MSFDRERLPDPLIYFEREGLCLAGRGKWRTTGCTFHGGSDSLRINNESGGWICMSCHTKGGDVLAYAMQAHGLEFIEARQLGAWIEDGKPAPVSPSPLSPRTALSVLAFESTLIAVEAARVARGMTPTPDDIERVLKAANRINMIAEDFA